MKETLTVAFNNNNNNSNSSPYFFLPNRLEADGQIYGRDPILGRLAKALLLCKARWHFADLEAPRTPHTPLYARTPPFVARVLVGRLYLVCPRHGEESLARIWQNHGDNRWYDDVPKERFVSARCWPYLKHLGRMDSKGRE